MTELFFESILKKSINLKNLAFELAVAIFDIEPKNEKLILCQTVAKELICIHKCNHNHLQNSSKNASMNRTYKTNNFALGSHRFTAP